MAPFYSKKPYWRVVLGIAVFALLFNVVSPTVIVAQDTGSSGHKVTASVVADRFGNPVDQPIIFWLTSNSTDLFYYQYTTDGQLEFTDVEDGNYALKIWTEEDISEEDGQPSKILSVDVAGADVALGTIALQDRLFPRLSRLPKPPKTPRVERNIEWEGARVVINSPTDQSAVNRLESLEVEVNYQARHTDIKLGDSPTTTIPTGVIMAIELFLNGESVGVEKVSSHSDGSTNFTVDLGNLPEEAQEARLQAHAYNWYFSLPSLSPRSRQIDRNRVAAESEVVTVQFKDVIGPEGGVVEGEGGVQVVVPPGAFNVNTPVSVKVDPFSWKDAIPATDEAILLGVIDLEMRDIEQGKFVDISIPAPAYITDDDQVLVVRVLEDSGAIRYQLVDIAKLEDDQLISQFIPFPFPLLGIITKGLYGFLIPKKDVTETAKVGYVKGIVSGPNGQPVDGAIVTVSELPLFVYKTKTDGEYFIPSLVGNFAVTAFDPKTGNFKTEGSAITSKGGGVVVDIQLETDQLDLEPTLVNGGFENGLTGWEAKGQVSVVNSLGPLFPQEGNAMVLMTTGSSSVNRTFSTLKQRFIVPPGTQKIIFKYDFITREYPEFVGSRFNDVFKAVLLTNKGAEQLAFMEVNHPGANFQPIVVSFPNEDAGDSTMGHTDWRTAEVNIQQFTGDGKTIFSISDVGDTIYDSGVLIDDIRLVSGTDPRFLSSPLSPLAGTPKTLPINSVFDHNLTKGSVVAYTRERGEGSIIEEAQCLPNVEQGKTFFINGNYHATGNPKTLLCYDNHNGVDFRTVSGQRDIYAAADGIAVLNWDTDCYHTITIKHSNGYQTKYAHLNESPLKNSAGKNIGSFPVTRGELIGKAGGWGALPDNISICDPNRFGIHLHFGTVTAQGVRVDPYGWNGDPSEDPYKTEAKNIYLWND